MATNRNGMDPSVVPQSSVGPVMPMPFDGYGVAAAPAENQRPAVSSATLASTLASATPENQRLVCLRCYFTCRIYVLFPLE